MAKLISLPNGRCDLKFNSRVTNFNRVEKLNYKKNFLKLYIDKNNSIYDIKRCEVVTWKSVDKGKKKIKVPDEISETRDLHLFNKVKGVPFKIAVTKITAEIDMAELLA